MADFAKPPVSREQMVLYPVMLDQIIGPKHVVRLFDDILHRIDWVQWVQQFSVFR